MRSDIARGTRSLSFAVVNMQDLLTSAHKAARSASSVRNTVNDAFDQVEKMFADIELFIQMYPEDGNIERASIDLLTSTLFAAENVIGFFTKGTCMLCQFFLCCMNYALTIDL